MMKIAMLMLMVTVAQISVARAALGPTPAHEQKAEDILCPHDKARKLAALKWLEDKKLPEEKTSVLEVIQAK